jgi:hypothetical protein
VRVMTPDIITTALRHLSDADPVLARVIAQAGPPTRLAEVRRLYTFAASRKGECETGYVWCEEKALSWLSVYVHRAAEMPVIR